ncbi:MAG: hypothetical protein M1818_003839 [Claussenomyces sp. TS43310]|nr:MAG: hypothetical protein M1818_003839 [Claussenomyces sp. TS43310]
MPKVTPPLLRVAIIGGGPGGLAAAISLSALPNVRVSVYEQARELREIGAGIQIGFNCWKILELLGAADGVKGHVQSTTLQRNGKTGEVIGERLASVVAPQYRGQRVRRTRLQAALIAKVPKGVIRLRKRLVSLDDVGEGGVRLLFEDGEETLADLLVGGDGIRSVVRQHVFPDHAIKFTGRSIWRVIIPKSLVADIPEMTSATSWWHGPNGHFYNCLVDDPSEISEEQQMFEIAAHSVAPPESVKEKTFSWGIPATNERVESHFKEYDPRVRDALSRVPSGLWKEFSSFSGPRLEKITAWDKVVLIGDASHPLTGAFGSGAAFAMQDGYILARAIEHTRSSPDPLVGALEIFDSIRSPYYHRMYKFLDQQQKNIRDAKAQNPEQTFEESLQLRVAAFGGEDAMAWIYKADIQEIWKDFLTQEKHDG